MYCYFGDRVENADLLDSTNLEDFQIRVDVFVGEWETTILKYESSAKVLQKGISTWYKAFKRVALVLLLSMVVFAGIKMVLSSVAEKKAKYKKFLIDWLTAICLLFVLNYLMLFILTISDNLTQIFLTKGTKIIQCTLPENTTIEGDGIPLREQFINDEIELTEGIEFGEENQVTWYGDFVGYIRLKAGLENSWQSVQYSIIYLVLVVYTCIFTVMYIKRTLYMAFFTMIAPLVAITYPLDMMKDNQAQAFSTWLKEYVFNALIQPVHLIIYTMTISTVMEMLVIKHPVYALVALGFIMPAERFLRKMFGFEKASTLSAMGQMAGGAMVFSGIQKLSALGQKKKKQNDDDKKQDAIRTEDKNGIKLAEPKQNSQKKTSNVVKDGESNKRAQSTITTNTHPKQNTSPNPQNVDQKQLKAQSKRLKVQKSNHSVRRAVDKLGARSARKALKSRPLKTLGRWHAKALGAAALGSIGLVAGVASGDFGKVATYTAGAAGVGAKIGGNVSDNIWDEAKDIKEDFRKGYLGEDEYNNRELNKEFFMSDGWIDIENDSGIFPELSGHERRKAIKETTQEYLDAGIDDPKKIQEGMKCGLSTEEAIYAIKLAEIIGKDDWNDPDKKAAFKERYQSALGDNANEIWKNINKFF